MSSFSPARRWLLAVVATSTLALTTGCGIGQQADDTSSTDDTSSSTESTDTGSSSTDESTDDAGTGAETGGTYTAGEYDAEGSYETPGGTQSVSVDVTIDAEGTIEAVEVTPQAESGNSVQFQGQFADGIADEVVGQKIDDLSVSKVAGSSLTSGGFNAAIDEIVAEAQA